MHHPASSEISASVAVAAAAVKTIEYHVKLSVCQCVVLVVALAVCDVLHKWRAHSPFISHFRFHIPLSLSGSDSLDKQVGSIRGLPYRQLHNF